MADMPYTGSLTGLRAELFPPAESDAAGLPVGSLPEGVGCWALTNEAVKTAPRIAVVNAVVGRRKPRLLAFVGLALIVIGRSGNRIARWLSAR